jgi:hypothetical protein
MVLTPLTFVFFSAWPVAILYLFFIVVSVLAFPCHLVPRLTSYSHKHLHILQARTSMPVQAANVVYPRSQSWPIHSPDGHFRRGNTTRDYSVGKFLYRAQFEAWCYTFKLERLGLHAP